MLHRWGRTHTLKTSVAIICQKNSGIIWRESGKPSYLLTNWLAYLCGRIQSPRPDVMPDRREGIKATFHLTVSIRGQRATGKIQRNNYRHGSCGPSLTGKTSSVSLIFTHGTHRNVKNR